MPPNGRVAGGSACPGLGERREGPPTNSVSPPSTHLPKSRALARSLPSLITQLPSEWRALFMELVEVGDEARWLSPSPFCPRSSAGDVTSPRRGGWTRPAAHGPLLSLSALPLVGQSPQEPAWHVSVERCEDVEKERPCMRKEKHDGSLTGRTGHLCTALWVHRRHPVLSPRLRKARSTPESSTSSCASSSTRASTRASARATT